ncbi:MAG: hypothetical protein AAGC44_10115 [Planctomycetota bacterium]
MPIRRCQFATLVAALALFVGCRQVPPHYHAADVAPLHHHFDGSARSLVSDTQAMSRLSSENADDWYLNRRDFRPSVQAGYVSARRETTVTFTRDSQYISGGRVRDHYRQTTIRRSVQESQR